MAYMQYVTPSDNLYDTPRNIPISRFNLIHKTSKLLICEDSDNIIITDKQKNITHTIPNKYITSIVFARCINIILCSTEHGSVLFYKLDGTLLKRYDERKEKIDMIVISKNNEFYATFSKKSNIINIMHFDTDELLQRIKFDDVVTNIIFSDDYFVIGCENNLHIYKFEGIYKFYKSHQIYKKYIKLLPIEDNGIIIISQDLTLHIFNFNDFDTEKNDETQFIMSNIIENYITNDISNLILF